MSTAEETRLRRDLKAVLDRAGELRALGDHRDFTDAECDEVAQLRGKAEDLQSRIDAETEKRGFGVALDALLNPSAHAAAAPVATDRELKQAASDVEGAWVSACRGGAASVEVNRRALLGAKAMSMTPGPVPAKAVTGAELDQPYAVNTRLYPGDYVNAPLVANLFPQAAAAGPIIRTYRTANLATADTVAEGALKPDAGVTVEPVDTEMTKIANVLRVTEELLADAAAFADAFGSEMIQAVRARENAFVLDQVLNTSGVQTATAANVPDGVASTIATLAATTGQAADAVILNPADLATLRTTRTGADGAYLLDPTSADPARLWGVTLVVVPGLTAGTVLVGSFATAGQFFTRDVLRLDTAYSGDDFERNTRTLRAEERVGVAVVKPAHLVRLTIGTAA